MYLKENNGLFDLFIVVNVGLANMMVHSFSALDEVGKRSNGLVSFETTGNPYVLFDLLSMFYGKP